MLQSVCRRRPWRWFRFSLLTWLTVSCAYLISSAALKVYAEFKPGKWRVLREHRQCFRHLRYYHQHEAWKLWLISHRAFDPHPLVLFLFSSFNPSLAPPPPHSPQPPSHTRPIPPPPLPCTAALPFIFPADVLFTISSVTAVTVPVRRLCALRASQHISPQLSIFLCAFPPV